MEKKRFKNDYNLQCYSQNDSTYYPTEGAGVCSLILATNEPGVQEFKIYPNPSTGKIRIEGFESPIIALKVFDISGRMVYQESGFKEGTALDMSALGPGLYFLNGTGQGQHFRGNVVLE